MLQRGFPVITAKILSEPGGYREIFLNGFRVKNLECVQGWESLHFDQLWLELIFFAEADPKIECDELRAVFFSRNKINSRDGFLGVAHKTGCGNNIYDGFAGTDHFYLKIRRHKYRSFRHAKFNGTRMFIIQFFQEGPVFLFRKILIE